MARKSDNLNIRMDPAIKEAGRKAAADSHRTLAALIEMLLAEYLEKHGYLPRKDDERR